MLEPRDIENVKKRLGKLWGTDKIKFRRQLLCPTMEAESLSGKLYFF